MSLSLKHEYRLKFYLNAQHYFVNATTGEKGDTHPHTWEFCLSIAVSQQDITPFYVFERGVNEYLAPYQNQVMNDCAPFDMILPTLESMTEQFTKDFYEIIDAQGGALMRVEGSEGPTRSYIVTVEHGADTERQKAKEREALSGVIDNVLNGILD